METRIELTYYLTFKVTLILLSHRVSVKGDLNDSQKSIDYVKKSIPQGNV